MNSVYEIQHDFNAIFCLYTKPKQKKKTRKPDIKIT